MPTPSHQGTPSSPLYDFDTVLDRLHSDSGKWRRYPADVLPLWVADMDFPSPPPILQALHTRVDHGFFGYGMEPPELRELLCTRMSNLYGWQVTPEQIIFLPGLVCGLNVVSRAIGAPGDGVMVNTPVYPPFLSAPVNHDRVLNPIPLAVAQHPSRDGRTALHYTINFAAMEEGLLPNTRLFILCNPHNPVGRAYTRPELEQLAEFCLRHDLVLCSDEIHCDLLMGDTQHTPIAALGDEIAARTITLMAPSKTFNIPGLGCSFAVVPNVELRRRIEKAMAGIVPHVNLLGFVATYAAYAHCDDWLAQLRAYLTANRDFLFDYVKTKWPQVGLTLPEATYLGWLNFGALGIEQPYQLFLEQGKVALGDGVAFGAGGEGFVRLNYGCPRPLLEEALARMSHALELAVG